MTSRTPRAFTLFEMLVAIALVLAILGVSVRLIADLGDARTRTEAGLGVVVGTSELFDLLQSRLDTATAVDAAGGPGVVGDEVSLTVNGCRVRPHRLVDDVRGHPLQDRAALEIRFADDSIEVREDAGGWSAIVSDPTAIRFRYFDGREWRDRWDGSVGLPVAIEVRVWTSPWPDGDTPAWIEASIPEETADVFPDPLETIGRRDFDRREVSFDEAPAPDRLRVFSILDAAAPTEGGR